VTAVDRPVKEYLIRLADGERVEARRVVMAVGISYFDYIPPNLSALPGDLLSHTSKHADLSSFRGRKVIVVGGGSSAMDTAALLVDAGVDVQMVSRREALKFPPKPTGEAPSLLQRLRRPPSGLGNGLRRRFLCNRPQAFHYLPERLRLYTVRRALGPAGGWFSKDMVVGRVPLRLGYVPEHSEVKDGMAHLHLRRIDGSRLVIAADHVIAATGYRVAVDRLTLLSQNIRSNLACVNDSPILSGDFEASIPGLYFVGLASANSFGPVMRFAVGARFTAERVTAAVVKSVVREQRK
jgi:thioredoxin reductase